MSSTEKKRFPKKKIAAAVVILALLSLVSGCIWSVRRGMNQMQAMLADTADQTEARRGTILSTVHGSGTLAVAEVAEVRAPSGIEVEEVFFETGDTVQKGDVLARLSGKSILQALIRIESDVKTIDDTVEEDKDLTDYKKEELQLEKEELLQYKEDLEQLRKNPVIISDAEGVIDQLYLTEGAVISGQSGSAAAGGQTDTGALSQMMQNFSSAGMVSADVTAPAAARTAFEGQEADIPDIPQGILLSDVTVTEEEAAPEEIIPEAAEEPVPVIEEEPVPVTEEEPVIQEEPVSAAQGAVQPAAAPAAEEQQVTEENAAAPGEGAAAEPAGGEETEAVYETEETAPAEIDTEALRKAGEENLELFRVQAAGGSGETESAIQALGRALQSGTGTEIPTTLILQVLNSLASVPLTAGGTPVTNLADSAFFMNDYYTSEISWNPADAAFVNGVTYRAAFVLKAKDGYVFGPLPDPLPSGIETGSISEDGKTASVTVVFPAVTTVIPAAAPILKVMTGLASATPVPGAAPAASLSDTEFYSTQIAWEPADSVFAEGTAYKAAFEMTAKDGYVFEALPAGYGGISDQLQISRSEDGKKMTVTVQFPEAVSGEKELAAFRQTVLQELQGMAGAVSGELGRQISRLSSEALGSLPGLSSLGSLAGLGALGSLGSLGSLGGLSLDMDEYSGLAAASAGSTYSSRQVVVCTVSRMEEVKITVRVDEQDILSVEKGQKAELTLDALEGRTFEGTVTDVAQSAEASSGSAKFAVEITAPMDPDMRIGMTASADIAVGEAKEVLLIPIQALQQTGDRTFVYTEQNQDATLGGEKEVETGLSDGTDVQILSGLNEGDAVYYEKESYNPFYRMTEDMEEYRQGS